MPLLQKIKSASLLSLSSRATAPPPPHPRTHRKSFERSTTTTTTTRLSPPASTFSLSLFDRTTFLSLSLLGRFSKPFHRIRRTPPLTTKTKALSISFSLLFLSLSSRDRGIIFSKSIIFLGFRFLENFDFFLSDEIQVES
jgi:hypothetical protein